MDTNSPESFPILLVTLLNSSTFCEPLSEELHDFMSHYRTIRVNEKEMSIRVIRGKTFLSRS